MAEALESWPIDVLGHFMAMNYRYKPRDTRLVTDMAVGMPKQRLVSRDVIVDHYFSLSLTFGEEAYFRWWLKERLDLGTGWCLLPLHSGAGMNDCTSQFVDVGESRRVGLRYQIDCHVITRDKPAETLTEEQALALVDYGTAEVQTGAALLHDTIHTQG